MQLRLHYINNILLPPNYIKGLTSNPKLKQLAKDKRKAGFLPEVAFWMQVHKGKFHGIDFDRQRVIGNYIVDFYVKYLALVVEIDGSSHDGREEQDEIRENYLKNFGIRIFRATNQDVMNRMDYVLKELENYILSNYSLDNN